MELKDLLGEHILTGVEFGQLEKGEFDEDYPNTVDFILDGKIISAIENPCDGYRSSMKELIENRPGVEINNRFDPVKVVGITRNEEGYEDEVIDFFDSITKKIVLSVGTRHHDDYYPSFVQEWNPENLCHNQ